MFANNDNSQKSWLDNLCSSLTNAKRSQLEVEANNNILKYADFKCADCNSAFTKEYVINELGGICNKCDGSNIVCIKEQEECADEKMYQCTNCDNELPKSKVNKKCECGCTRFISKSLLEAVAINTAYYLVDQKYNVEDVWTEKGKIFASFGGVSEKNVPWKAVFAASGNFTKDDLVAFTYTGGEEAAAKVLTAQDDPFVKYANNDSCYVSWEISEDDPERFIQEAQLKDINGVNLEIGDILEWRTPRTVYKGEIVSASANGDISIGITQDEYGAVKDSYASVIDMDQNSIGKYGIEVIARRK